MMNKAGDECVTRTPQVSAQVQRLEKAIARMAEVRSQVEGRISAILMPATPCGPEPGEDKPQAVPLAQELERLAEQVNGLSNSMEDMLSRVEL